MRAALQGRLKLEELSDSEQDTLFGKLSCAFEAPSSEVSEAYAELGQQRRRVRAARGAA
jgi:hypothetical protein